MASLQQLDLDRQESGIALTVMNSHLAGQLGEHPNARMTDELHVQEGGRGGPLGVEIDSGLHVLGGDRGGPQRPPRARINEDLHAPESGQDGPQVLPGGLSEHQSDNGHLSPKHRPCLDSLVRFGQITLRQWAFMVTILVMVIGFALLGWKIAQLKGETKNEISTIGSAPNITTISESASSRHPADYSYITVIGMTEPAFEPGLSANEPDSELAYVSGKQICIRTKSQKGSSVNNGWNPMVTCVDGTNVKEGGPISFLNWKGGPSLYFLDGDGYLSGIDYSDNTWILSSVRSCNISAHNQSQLATTTWFNGSSTWIYYQDPTGDLREWGMDDYRDRSWRAGKFSPLGTFAIGSGIGLARWINTTQSLGDETLEYYVQLEGNAIHGRTYTDGVWLPNEYMIHGTDQPTYRLPTGPNIQATIVEGGDNGENTTVILVYWSDEGFVAYQTKMTFNISAWDSFSAPKTLLQGDSGGKSGLTLLSWKGNVRLDTTVQGKIYEQLGHATTGGDSTDVLIQFGTATQIVF